MSILQDISKRLLDVSNVPPEKRNDALMQVLIYIETVQYDMVLEQKNLIMSVIEDLIAENDAEQIAKSKLVFVEDVEEQIAPTKKTRAKKVVAPVMEVNGEDLPDFIDRESKIKNLPEPVQKLGILRTKEKDKDYLISDFDTLSSSFKWDKTPEGDYFWRKIHNEGDLREFKKKFGNKGEKVDDLIEFAELNEFVEGLSQPVASGDLPDTIGLNILIKDFPEPIKKLALFRQKEQNKPFDENVTIYDDDAFIWATTPEGGDFWEKIEDKGDLTEFKRIYGNKGENVDNLVDGLVGFNELLEMANKQNAQLINDAFKQAQTVKTRKPRTPKVASVVAKQKLLFLRLIFNPPVGSPIKFEVYNPEELHYIVLGIFNKLDVVSLTFPFEAVSDFSSYLTNQKLYYHNEPSDMVDKLIEQFNTFVIPELDWSDFNNAKTDKDRIESNNEILFYAFQPAKVVTPKPVKVVTPKVVTPKVVTPKVVTPKIVTPKPVKVVAPKVVKTKVTKPKVEDDLSFLDDLENIF